MIRRPPRSTGTDTLFPYSVLFTIVQRVLERIGRPLVIHMMDDWPARLEASNPERFREMDRDLRSLIGRSQRLLSISGAMSAAYHERSEERRVGKECVSTFRSRWSPYH